MIKAFLSGGVVAVLSSFLGAFVVVKRYSMLSDSLAHISLIGVAIGFLFSLSTTLTTLITLLLISWLIEYIRSTYNLYSDSILSIFLSSSLAIAIIIVSLSNSFNSSLFDYLFGSILAVTSEDLIIITTFGAIAVLLLLNYYRQLLFIAFDEEVAKCSKIDVKFLNFLLISLIAITIGLSIKIVGALLIGALMIIPMNSALLFKLNFLHSILLSILMSISSVVIGLVLSFYYSLPSGATIVVISLIIFISSLIITKRE
jgi:zinc transport system permease protein